jgi:hypothetical protein
VAATLAEVPAQEPRPAIQPARRETLSRTGAPSAGPAVVPAQIPQMLSITERPAITSAPPRRPQLQCRVRRRPAMLSTRPQPIKPNKSLAILILAFSKSRMKDFSNASFSPEVIQAKQQALDDAVSTLPDPVSSKSVQEIAEHILRARTKGSEIPWCCG